jgi:23S rRNA pseudouridine2605 synthase
VPITGGCELADQDQKRVGLARALSKLGFSSRSQAFVLVREGRVKVNGRQRNDPEFPVVLRHDKLSVDGKPVATSRPVYLMVNKPRGIVTTASDEKGRATVYSLIPEDLPWIAPVGRLDKASEGLLLLTNDSEWAARITDPHSHLDKIYHVQVAAQPDEALLQKLTTGIASDGEPLRARHASILRGGAKNSWLEIVLDEGRNRQIRRMLDALGIEVLRLVRVAIGPLQLGDLARREFRELLPSEKQAIDRALAE